MHSPRLLSEPRGSTLAREMIDYEIDQAYRLFLVGSDTFQLAQGYVRDYRPGLNGGATYFPAVSTKIWLDR